MELSDEKLIKNYLSGELGADVLLYDRYAGLIYSIAKDKITYGIAKEEVIQDIVQDVFIKIFRNIGNFDSSLCSFKNWICVIAKNTIIDFFRKNREQCFTEFEEADGNNPLLDTLENDTSIIDDLHGTFQAEKCYDEIRKLTPKVQGVIFLHLKGYTFEEIGIITEASKNTVKSQYRRAINKLKNSIKK